MRRALLAAAVLALALPAAALEVPYLSGRVVDEARLLDAASAQDLETTLKAFEQRTGRQVAVLTLPSLEGEVLEDFSIKVARTWKLGRAGRNDGVLILVARDDRKARIEVGYGNEGALTDAAAGRIIRDRMVPRFRAGDYAGGIKDGAAAVLGTLDGSYSPPPDLPLPAGVARRIRLGGARRAGGGGVAAELGIRVVMSLFFLFIVGAFEFAGVTAPGVGWFLYFFLIPFWAAFPMGLWGPRVGGLVLLLHVIGFPILKLLLARSEWGRAAGKKFHARGNAVYFGGSGWSSGGGSSWSSGDSGGGFSGGGGDFGGGGASGSW